MASPSMLCRVQALYPFESNDPSSLKFDQGDFIDVLTKLPSGWWDGWCNGVRGWFPSNHVQMIADYGGTELVSSTTTTPTISTATALPAAALPPSQLMPTRPRNANRRLSTQTELFDDRVGSSGNQVSSKRASLPPNWSIQEREDGSASYYLNTLTGEMRSTYPYDDSASFYDADSDEDSAASTFDSNSRSDSVLDVNYLPRSEESVVSDPSVKDIQGKWIQRTTPQGLPFFYNLSTHETAWQPNSQGSLRVQTKLPPINNNTTSTDYPLQPSPSIDNNEMITWNKLSVHITLTINTLIASVKHSQSCLYKTYAARVVNAVKFMLIASGTISKESSVVKTSNVLRSHHRTMMASLSKLVLSVHLFADDIVNEVVTKLLSDCHELLAAVRNFISTCENMSVEVHLVDPHLMSWPHSGKRAPWDVAAIQRLNSTSGASSGSKMDQGIRAKYELHSDLIENLDAYGASMQESMKSLLQNLTRQSDSRCALAELLFSQYRNFGNQNSQFLSIIEDIDFDGVIQLSLMKQVAAARQKLYDGLGLLFFKMQTMTDETVPMDKVIPEMQQAAQSIIDAIKLVCNRMADLVQEKKRLIKDQGKAVTDNTSSNRSSFIGPTDKDAYSGEFLRNSSGSHDLFFDLSLSSSLTLKNSSLTSIEDFKRRSQSLTVDTAQHSNDDSSIKSNNRASAPVTENTTSFMAEALKNRSHTLTEVQSKHTSAKLKQFFGDDLPDASDAALTSPSDAPAGARKASATPSNASAITAITFHEDEQRYLQYDYSLNEIVLSVEGSVRGGTLRALVERMTLHDYLDMNFNSTFLLTYRSFCTSMELLELLEARYNIQPPADLTPEEVEIWGNKKQKLIRLRVFNVLKIWLEQYYYEEDSVILDRLLRFTTTSIKETLSFSAFQLERLIQKRKEACTDLKKLIITQQQDSPDPILPRNLKKFRLLDLDATELARQLTLMDFKLYSSIKPVECLDKAWSRDTTLNDDHRTPVARNIQASIDYCNQVTTWVSDEILSQSEVKKRSALIKHWVNVADRCRLFNNFNTCMAILSAFDNSAVGRLKRTWEMVGARTNHIVAEIRKLMGASRNFNLYRALIHSVNPPCIPFLGIYLQDLTFIEDGNPNFLKTPKDLINFAKRAQTAEVIREIQQYQTMGYQFRPVDEIQNFILDSLHSSRDEDQLYKESLKLEPKERDDEKITRLLQESGFL